jgi:Zn ribbon nucleic-acid-binding protein
MSGWPDCKVPCGCECPRCNENRVRYLSWRDDETTVDCEKCGHRYVPKTRDDYDFTDEDMWGDR